MAEIPVVAPVQRTLSSKSGLTAVIAIALVLLLIEARTGRLSALLRQLPVVGPWFARQS